MFKVLHLVVATVLVVSVITGLAYYTGWVVGGLFDYPKPTAAVFATYALVQSVLGALRAWFDIATAPRAR